MTFPKTALTIKVELYYSAAWNDITADVNSLNGIQITRGRSNESGNIEPSSCNMTLRNPTGKYSPRNPNSPLYGLIGRNTPIRVSVQIGGVWYQRFIGEVTAWPQKWGKKGATQSFAPIECAGVLRRLGQGAAPVRSTLYRGIASIGSNLVGYWPCEDSTGSTTLKPVLGRTGKIVGSPTLAAYDDMPASSALPNIGNGRFICELNPYTNTDKFQVRFITVFPAGGLPNNTVIARIYTNNSLGWMDVIYTTASSGSLSLQPYTKDNVATTAIGAIAYGLNGNSWRIDVEAQKNGAGIDFLLLALKVGAGSASYGTANVASATLGSCTRVEINPAQATLTDFMVGHISVEKAITTVFDLQQQSVAYFGERVHDRLVRLCAENGIQFGYDSNDGTSPRMGYQGRETLVDLLAECASTGYGNLHERRSTDGLYWRSLDSMFIQTTADCTIPYTDNLLIPFEPVDDDESTRNKVTVTRDGGASFTVEDTTSRLSTSAPPTGVGTYDEAVTMSLADDIAVRHHAGWRVHMGTVDEARWPRIGLDLAHPYFTTHTDMYASILNLTMGDRLDVTNLPSWLPPDPVQGIIQGYTETIEPFHWKIVFNCTPFRPYRAAYWKSTGINDRYSNSTTTLNAGITSTATTLQAAFTSGPRWTIADGSFDIMVAGERMTVTNVTGTTSPQTFTVTRSVNGVVKAQSSGASITLYDPTYYGL